MYTLKKHDNSGVSKKNSHQEYLTSFDGKTWCIYQKNPAIFCGWKNGEKKNGLFKGTLESMIFLYPGGICWFFLEKTTHLHGDGDPSKPPRIHGIPIHRIGNPAI